MCWTGATRAVRCVVRCSVHMAVFGGTARAVCGWRKGGRRCELTGWDDECGPCSVRGKTSWCGEHWSLLAHSFLKAVLCHVLKIHVSLTQRCPPPRCPSAHTVVLVREHTRAVATDLVSSCMGLDFLPCRKACKREFTSAAGRTCYERSPSMMLAMLMTTSTSPSAQRT